MKIHEGTKWLCENARRLEKFEGQWVMFSVKEGLVSRGASLDCVMKSCKKRQSARHPFVFHVPSKDELRDPIPVLKKA